MKKQKKQEKKYKQKQKKKDPIQEAINKYKYKKVGIIKDVKFGFLVGTRFGAFAWMHDGGFGMSLSIIEVEHGFSNHFVITDPKQYEAFFRQFEVIWHNQLKGKYALLLSNTDAINSIEAVVPHKNLMESLKEDKILR